MTTGRGTQTTWTGRPLALGALALSGCSTTYAGFPDAVRIPAGGGGATAAHFTIKKFDILNAGGEEAIEDTLRESPAFADADRLYEGDPAPDKGILVTVEPAYRAPSLPAVVFGYISLSTLTILPAYSGQDGYQVSYRVSVDGAPAGTYRYTIRRKFGLWLPLLPFIWVNLLTTSERDAFHPTTEPVPGGRTGGGLAVEAVEGSRAMAAAGPG